MKIGTKSLLFGVHQCLWHPFTVWLAWIRVHRRLPGFVTCLCILLHDVGYWGCDNLDGPQGKRHPYRGARYVRNIVRFLTGSLVKSDAAYDLCIYHSSSVAYLDGRTPSPLYLPDKVSILCEPGWFYMFRAWLSGELSEYVDNSPAFVGTRGSWPWYHWYRGLILSKLSAHKPK